VKDNGRGFNADEAMDELPHNGKLGLLGMQERMLLLGGSMEVISKPAEGTTLCFSIPTKK
jgi:signal transduction histidine kinase